MKAIETRYAGRYFRSRLEARWAIVFDSLRISWEHEPEGFELDSGRYLPDFRLQLPRGPVWFEVKPPHADGDVRWQELSKATGMPLYVSFGLTLPSQCRRPDGLIEAVHPQGWDNQHLPCICPKCGAAGFEYHGRGRRVCGNRCFTDDADERTDESLEVTAALTAAMSARFDRDEPQPVQTHLARVLACLGERPYVRFDSRLSQAIDRTHGGRLDPNTGEVKA